VSASPALKPCPKISDSSPIHAILFIATEATTAVTMHGLRAMLVSSDWWDSAGRAGPPKVTDLAFTGTGATTQ